ncbi:restriction endonuclease [Gordonia sp. NPDC127522]|uniref:restriction endonuclease n=1 Tax=Gordonia sp. NPDC127522 TaxID=3345390 RepID=UPI003643DCFC
MDLNALLDAFDKTAANLEKLEAVWRRASPMLPSGPALGSNPEYDDLARAWKDLCAGLPPIDNWRIDRELPDLEAVGQGFLEYAEIGEVATGVYEAIEKPDRDLAGYRYRLHRARRKAIRGRLQTLTETVDAILGQVSVGLPATGNDPVRAQDAAAVLAAVEEIERLLGDTVERRGRWSDLHRHLRFAQPHDWRDIASMDWPSVRNDIDSAGFGETDPLPVPEIDLGAASEAEVTGAASTAMQWHELNDDEFERLLFDVLRGIPQYENVTWLMATRAPDRGRDLGLDRVLHDGSGTTRRERVIVQAKHWLSKSVNVSAVSDTLANMPLWTPPVVNGLIIATSGRFTVDAVDWIERHNNTGNAPMIEMWPDSRLESLLSQRPGLVAAYGLRRAR